MKALQIFEYILMGIAVFVIFKLLKKFNILGVNENTEQAKLLGEEAALNSVVTQITSDPKNVFLLAIRKKFGSKPTAQQMDSLLPNKNLMPKSAVTLKYDVHNNFTPNDASMVFNVFKNFKSQYEINFFSTLYGALTKQDLYGTLDKLMFDSDMAKLRTLINSKPLI